MKTILSASFLALAACATTGEAPVAGADAPYRAFGTEPFWSLDFANGRIVYQTPDNEPVDVAMPRPSAIPNGRRYVTAAFTVDITAEERCNDGMSDREFADTVRIAFAGGGATFAGCGGPPLAPESLAGTAWAIVEIGGEAVSGERYTLGFTANRISGQAGCNRFAGSYTRAGDTLTPGPLAMTRMACANALDTPGGDPMAHEARATGILGGPVEISFPDGDTLVLTGANGAIRLRRSI